MSLTQEISPQADKTTRRKLQFKEPFAAIQRYGLAVVSVALAIAIALVLDRFNFRGGLVPPFLFAVAIAAWYGGGGAAVLALLLACFSFDYFFVAPLYTFYITSSELPYFLLFGLFAALVTWWSGVRRRVEEDLRQTRDNLEKEVALRRSLNKELEIRSDELQASNKELEAFAYSTSHDLRAPLRHMVGYTELLQKHASATFDDKSRRYMATILEAAKKMGTLIDDLLAFSRIGRVETREASVSLEYLVNEVLSEMPAQDDRKVDWKIGALPEVYGDRSMLKLALVNLMSNAVKFTRTRSRPEIEIGCAEKKDNRAVVFVKDNGVGFDMKYEHKLFGVFQRLHSTEAFEGTGIGLATVQRIVHRHRGRVWAESAVDKGATFYFSVPTQGN